MKRRLLIIAVCLLLGAVVNVAVAWGCALLPMYWVAYPGNTPARTFGGERRQWSGKLSTPRDDDTFLGDDWAGDWFVYMSERAGVYGVVVFGPWVGARTDDGSHVGERLPKWVSRALFGSKEISLIVDSRGWPFPTLYSVTNLEDKPISAGGFSPLPPLRSGTLQGTSDALPFRPIWTAFASNTLFYAAILWLLIGGLFALRRFRRFRRGLCPKCAYPMGESAVCTECGGAVPGRLVKIRRP